MFDTVFEDDMEAESELFPEENDGFPEFGKHGLRDSPIFEVEVSQSAEEGVGIKLRLEPLEVVYSKLCHERVKGFM
jgi:hypothetical protein